MPPRTKPEEPVTILVVGDVMGKSGRRSLGGWLPGLRRELNPELVVVNCENAAAGIGVTIEVAKELFKAGADVLTSGNHIWKYPEIKDYLNSEPRLLRPHNYPAGVPGSGWGVFSTPGGYRVGVLNLLGRVFMDPVECPFLIAHQLLSARRDDYDCAIVDFHAEATSEKSALAMHLDGRVGAVLGTHTHIPTADCRILPGGTGFQTDIGMTGSYNSVIGMHKSSVLPRFLTGLPTRFEPDDGEATLCATLVRIDAATNKCREIIPIRRGGVLAL